MCNRGDGKMSEYAEWSYGELDDEISNAKSEIESIQERINEMEAELDKREKNVYLSEKEEMEK